MDQLWVFLLFGLIAVIGLVWGYYAAEKRRKAMAELAWSVGLDFSPHADSSLPDRFDAFTPFGRGSSRRASNLVHGRRNGIDWQMFDYRFTTGSGKNRHTHRYGIVAATVPMFFRELDIRPEGLFDKIKSAVGFDDLNFESDEFSRRYHVRSTHRKFAYDLIHPRMIEYLLSVPAASWQLKGNLILMHKSGRYAPQQLATCMTMIEGLLERVPEYLRQDMVSAPGRLNP